MAYYTDLSAYFAKYGQPVNDNNKSPMKNAIEHIFNTYINIFKHEVPDIDVKFFEINSNTFNASVVRIFDDSFAIIFRNKIFYELLNEFNAHKEYFDLIYEEHKTSFLSSKEIYDYYYIFIYLFLLGHELGHIAYGHFNINNKNNEFVEFSPFSFESTSENLNITNKYTKDLFRMYLELNADMFGGIVLLTMLHNINTNPDGRFSGTESFTALLKILSSSIYILFNLNTKSHSINKSDYPHPMIRMGQFEYYLKEQLNIIKKNLDGVSKIDFDKIINNEFFKLIEFQDINKLANCDVNQESLMDYIQKDAQYAQEGFNSFMKDIQKFSNIKRKTYN